MTLLLLTHLSITVFLTGLCWFIQVVHYPLFHHIPAESFPSYERQNFRTGYLTVPLMFAEMGTGLWLVWHTPEPVFIANAVLLLITGMSTLVLQVPAHLKLGLESNAGSIDKLIRANWIRTLSWTVRSLLLIATVAYMLS